MKTTLMPAALVAAILLISTPLRAARAGEDGGNPDDPAYSLYKKGYALILEENWREARDIFREILKKYPASEYVDDAEYWTAYSYRDENRKKAVESYKKFLSAHKESRYFDDALADFDQLLAAPALLSVPDVEFVAPDVSPVLMLTDSLSKISIASLPAPVLAPAIKMGHLRRMLGGRLRGMRGYSVFGLRDEKIDPDTRIRLEALNAVAMTGEDERSFTTLRKAALDRNQEEVIRVSAIEALSGFRKYDVLPVFLEIARNDTSEEMQLFAIDYIGSAAGDKEKAFDVLMELYSSLPAGQKEKRRMVFYSIAELGGERSIDFLSKVARSNGDYDLRREAIYYLGTIGGEKARTVLYEILDVK